MASTALDAKVAGSLARYRVMAIVTGSFLLLVTVGVILKYGVGVTNAAVVDTTRVIATTHGFVYIVYLIASADLWTRVKWDWARLGALVLGGVVPGLSFYLERRITRDIGNAVAS